MNEIKWYCLPFESLCLMQWHNLLELRINVFVVEQNCPYPEIDHKDPKSHHVFAELNGKVIAVARIVAPGVSYKEVSIGRVATDLSLRKKGLGIELMEKTIRGIESIYGNVAIRISAQTYLTKFYADFGFISTGKEYLEDGIPHVEMLKTPATNATNMA